MKNVKTFLEMCRRKFPSTRLHQSHSLTLKGNTVVLTLMLGDTYQMFDLNDVDLTRNPADLVSEIEKLFKKAKKEVTPDPVA